MAPLYTNNVRTQNNMASAGGEEEEGEQGFSWLITRTRLPSKTQDSTRES